MSHWKEENNQLVREFEFKDFQQAFGFMTQLALYAEHVNHHPNWSNIYNKVKVSLSTHDAGDVVTEKDRKFAKQADKVYENI